MSTAKKASTKVVTGIVRLSYANIFEPASINGSKPKYSVSLIIPKGDTKTIADINAAIDAAIQDGAAKFGGKIPNKAALKLPLRDGDIERDDEAYDGKYIKNGDRLIICQSNAKADALRKIYPTAEINPLGDWTGGYNVDTGATNRKLGSDMADSVTGGGLHGKDLSKADVSVNIYAWLMAQRGHRVVEMTCAIGDTEVNGIPYWLIVETARDYIRTLGGFEKFAEWGLV